MRKKKMSRSLQSQRSRGGWFKAPMNGRLNEPLRPRLSKERGHLLDGANSPWPRRGLCSFHTARQMSKLQDFGRHPKRRVLARIVPSGVSQFRTHDDAPRVYLVLLRSGEKLLIAVEFVESSTLNS
jgi:hypothetical protein